MNRSPIIFMVRTARSATRRTLIWSPSVVRARTTIVPRPRSVATGTMKDLSSSVCSSTLSARASGPRPASALKVGDWKYERLPTRPATAPTTPCGATSTKRSLTRLPTASLAEATDHWGPIWPKPMRPLASPLRLLQWAITEL